MPDITLELVANVGVGLSTALEWEVPLHVHVHNRIEKFAYQEQVRENSVGISYLENTQLSSWKNLHIADRSYQIAGNNRRRMLQSNSWDVLTGASYTSEYQDVLITHKTIVDKEARIHPLFWKHVLPDDTQEVFIRSVTHGNRVVVEDGYSIDLETNSSHLYTNYQNYYDWDSGSYQLYFVVSVDSSGNTTEELLNLVPAVEEGTWEDIDTTTGTWKAGLHVFTRSTSGGLTTYGFSESETYYVKPYENSFIQPLKPFGRIPEDAWYVRFTAGQITTAVTGSTRTYYVPEYDKQPFTPSKPYRFSNYQTFDFLNAATLVATRGQLAVLPSIGMHLTLRFYTEEGVIARVLTTNTGLEGTRYSTTDVFYESTLIHSWDERNGIIALGVEIPSGWTVEGEYYYAANDYEYNLIDLNPLYNKKMLDHRVIFYLIPNADADDRAVHHLLVNEENIIVECSQGTGIAHPNLQLLTSAGLYNSGTVVGMKYISEDTDPSFVKSYTAGFGGAYDYAILAEVSFLDLNWPERQIDYDVRNSPRLMESDDFASVIQKNPRILQSVHGYGEDGQEVPKNGVVVLQPPITLLSDYGGSLTEAEVLTLLKQHLDVAVYPVIEWVYPESEITIDVETSLQIDLEWSWEGEYTYHLYRRQNPTGAWTLIDTQTPLVEAAMTYTDGGLTANDVFSYGVRIEDASGIEYPISNIVTGRVAA